jgi:hypothetical protein
MRSYLSGRAGYLYRQTAGSWNILDTLSNVIISNHLSASRRFCHVLEPSMGFHEVLQDSVRFHEILWDFVGFHEVSVTQKVRVSDPVQKLSGNKKRWWYSVITIRFCVKELLSTNLCKRWTYESWLQQMWRRKQFFLYTCCLVCCHLCHPTLLHVNQDGCNGSHLFHCKEPG